MSAIAPTLQQALDRPAAGRYIGVSPATLACWAVSGKYRDLLPFALIGKKAMYKVSDLEAFVEAQFLSSSSAK